jgi:UDP-glucose 4-epimerase
MILITGAAGFIGSKVAHKFIELGFETITIDNLSTGRKENIPKETHLIEGSCGDKSIIDKLNSYKIDGIIHIAGQSSGEVSFDNPAYDLESNTLSTILLLDFARRKGIKRFVFASTMSVYGDQVNLPVTEGLITNPKSFYACGKLASENYLKIYAHLGIESTALRLFNVYGPGQNLDNLKQGMLSIYLAQAINDNEILVKGSKDRFRDFVYIDDVVNAFVLVFCKTWKKYDAYNICTGKPTTVNDLLLGIQNNLGKEVNILFKEGTPGDQFGIYGSYDKINKDYAWQPNISISEGLHLMVDWAKSEQYD